MLNNATVLAMAYEWVGEKVYFIGSSKGQLTLWRVPIANPDGLENVTLLGPASSVNSMIVDPFTGSGHAQIIVLSHCIMHLCQL